MLVPGVRQAIGVNNLPIDQISTVSITINGQRASANEFLLDGAPNTAPSQNQPVINANPDAVLEFKVETNSFSAEYGRASGGIFNVITKSGTNDPHATLYEFLRNDGSMPTTGSRTGPAARGLRSSSTSSADRLELRLSSLTSITGRTRP